MPKLDLIATRTSPITPVGEGRRQFQSRNRDDAMILIEVLGKARLGRPAAIVAPPPAAVAEQIREAFIPPLDEVVEVAKPVVRKAKRRAQAKK